MPVAQKSLIRRCRARIVRCAAALALAGAAAPVPAAGPLDAGRIGKLAFAGIYEQPVQLQDGSYEGEPFAPGAASRPRVRLISELLRTGDLDGDGKEEAAVLLLESSGGSGEFVYLAVVAQREGGLKNVATRLIGDRVKVRSFIISKRVLVLDLVVAGPEDAVCCPTRKLSKRFQWRDDQLEEVASLEQGWLKAGDLAGVTWRLTHFSRDQPVPDGIDITAVFEEQRVAGKSACNRYFGGIQGDGAQDIAIGPLAGTRMACAESLMAAEDRYQSALAAVTRFTFHFGRLAMSYRDGDAVRTLLFRASD